MKGLLQNLIGKEKGKFKLPEIIIDTNYEKIKIKSINDNEKSKLDNFQLLQKKSSLLRADEEYVFKFKGFEKICRDCFLELLRKIKLERKIKVKFLILDLETSILFRRLITWLEIKDADISCLFILDENEIKLSNYLTMNSTLFYIISINYIKKFEKQFFKEITNRKCIKLNIFIREQKVHLINEQIKLIDKLFKLTKNEIQFLNIFLPINESAILLDNSLNSLISLINQIKSIDNKIESDNYLKYSDQLAQLLFKNNLYPSIRYLNNFNENNKLIANQTFEILKKHYNDNKQNLIEQNCLLLIIDRSLDFITPLIHSSNYYQFVNQELEISLRAEFTLLDDQLENTTLTNIPEKLISISKKMTNEQNRLSDYRKLSDLAILDRKAILLSKHIEYVNQIKTKLNNGYQHLINLEMKLLNKEELKCKNELNLIKSNSKLIDKKDEFLENLINLDQKEFIIYLKRLLGNEINQLDWKRILLIYSILKEKLNSNTIKLIKNIITKDIELELDKMYELFKKLEQKNQTKLISLKNLINLIQNNELDEIKYPTVNYLTECKPNKLLIFISGGLSFNELNLVKTNLDTILISDAILYPRKFIKNLI